MATTNWWMLQGKRGDEVIPGKVEARIFEDARKKLEQENSNRKQNRIARAHSLSHKFFYGESHERVATAIQERRERPHISTVKRSVQPGRAQPIQSRKPMESEIKLEHFLPPRIIDECFENHIRVKVVPSLSDNKWAEYNIESDEILFNASTDRRKLAQHLSERAGITVEPEMVFIYVLYHEIYHFNQRKHLNKIKDIQKLKEVWSFRREMEAEAEDYAIRKFWDWKLDCSAKADYERWKNTLY